MTFVGKIAVNNDNFKSAADLHKRLQEFTVGDEVMIRVRPNSSRNFEETSCSTYRSVQSFEEV